MRPATDFAYLFACLPVRDRGSSIDWYTRVLGRVPDFLPNDVEAVWQICPTGSLYVLVDSARAGHGETTIVVDDLERLRRELHDRGIDAEPTIEIAGAGRKLRLRDPDQNIVSFVELDQ